MFMERDRIAEIINAFDGGSDGIAVLDGDRRLIYYNKACLDIYKLDRDIDYIGRNFDEIEWKELRPVIEEGREFLYRDGVYIKELKISRSGKGEETIQIIADYLDSLDPPLILIVSRNITEMTMVMEELDRYKVKLETLVKERTKELSEANEKLRILIDSRLSAEKELRLSEERVRLQFKAVPIPLFVWRKKGEEFVLADFNDAAADMTRGHVREYIGKSLPEVVSGGSEIERDIETCYREKKIGKSKVHYTGNRSGLEWELDVTYAFFPPDFVIVHAEDITARVMAEKELASQREHLEELVEERTSQLKDANLQLKLEIAQRTRAEAALAESEEKYRVLTELASDYTFAGRNHRSGAIEVHWCEGGVEKITGFTPAEKDELFKIERIFPEDIPVAKRHIEALFDRREVVSEMRIITKEGSIRWVQVYERCLSVDAGGETIEVIGAVKDITGRKNAEKEIKNRSRELFVLNRIHELFDAPSSREDILEGLCGTLSDSRTSSYVTSCDVDLENEKMFPVVKCAEGRPGKRSNVVVAIDRGLIREFRKKSVMIVREKEMLEWIADMGMAYEFEAIRKTLVLPIYARDGLYTVFLIGFTGEDEKNESRKRFFEIIGKQINLEIERMELIEEQKEHGRELKNYTGGLLKLLEKERRQIALNLHDGMGQSIVALNAEFALLEEKCQPVDDEALELLSKIREQLGDLTESTRQISYSLHPSMLEDLGLIPTLQWFIARFVENDKLHVEIESAGFNEELPGKVALALYRIAQEALTNTRRHADADKVNLKLAKGFPSVIMIIEDNGKGFSSEDIQSRDKGLGIVGMRERVAQLNGKFTIKSIPGKGTRIRVTIPLEGADDE